MSKYTVYNGEFVCHTCKKIVKSLRSYPMNKELTWMCEEKHLSKVSLETKKSKKSYEQKASLSKN
jgi:hypothetical protein